MFRLLARRSFGSLTVTQFLGAFNDNAFKQVVLLMVTLGVVPWVVEHPWAQRWDQALPSALFALPFVLFGAVTGAIADRASKTSIIRLAKVLEIVVMALALVAFQLESYPLLIGVLFLMGTQSALFGPSKYGSIPELLPERELSRGNALIQMTTMLAIILGTVVGGTLFDRFSDALYVPALVYVGIATVGTLTSLPIERLPAAEPTRRVDWNVPAEIVRHWRAMEGSRPLILAVLASSFFYLIAAVLVQVVNRYGAWLELSGSGTSSLNAVIAVGVAVGAISAARVSGDRIEPGLIPFGLGLMALALPLVVLEPRSFQLVTASLFSAGMAAGLFSVPVRALVQHLPRPERRGSVLGLSEVLDFTGIFLASGLYFFLNGALGLAPPWMFAFLGALAAVFFLLSLPSTAAAMVRLVLLGLVRCVYRLRVRGLDRLPVGGALLVANHVSFADAVLIGASAPRPVSFLMHRSFFRVPLVGWFARRMGAIPVAAGESPEAKAATLAAAAEQARNGALVCIFAEGAITRTGQLLPFRRGLERIAGPAGVPIVPVALDRLWGSVFSFERGRVFWKLPRRLPYPVDVVYGDPLASDTAAWRVRASIAEMVAELRSQRSGRRGSLAWRFFYTARTLGHRTALVEGIGDKRRELSYRQVLMLVLALRALLKEELSGESPVAVLLPPSMVGTVTAIALTACGRTVVNLNPVAENQDLRSIMERAGGQQLISSRRCLDGRQSESFWPGQQTLFVEDLIDSIHGLRKHRALLASLLPARLLADRFSPQRSARELATLVFPDPTSSGSQAPRSEVVELTHANLLSNVQAVLEVVPLEAQDAVLSVLPLHHSFGTTVGLWCPLLAGVRSVLHADALESRAVGALCRKEGVSILVGKPAFFRIWMGSIEPLCLSRVRLAMVATMPLGDELAREWEARYGFRLFEGYGCDEMSPVVALGLPDAGRGETRQAGHKPGTVGRPLPGVAVRVVEAGSHAPLPPEAEGLIEVKGPNLMRGYLGQPERTQGVLRKGWFVTGDRGRLDADGFLVLGQSRFADRTPAPERRSQAHG